MNERHKVRLTAVLCVALAAPSAAYARSGTAPPPPPPPSVADKDAKVEALIEEAIAKFKAGEHAEAVRLFEEAYDISPEPNYLFNIGRVHEESGDYGKAIEYYERFIQEPGAELTAKEAALERLRVLKAIVAEMAPEEEPKPDDPPPPIEDEPKKKRPKPPKMRIAGYALLGVGGALLITGAGFGGAARIQSNQLDDEITLEGRDDKIDKGKRNALIADIMFIAGGVAAITGLVLTLVSLKKGKGKSQRASLSPGLSRNGAGIVVRARF